MKPGFFDKLVRRLDKVEPSDMQRYMLRLIQEKGFFENVFEALEEGIIVVDLEGNITYVNQAACRFFALDKVKVLGEKLSDGLRGFDWDALIEAGGSISRDLEVFYPEYRYLNFYVTAIDEDREVGYVMLIRDITQTRKMTADRIESEKITALTMLAAGVAHELGNPLNSLTIHLQLLERKLKKLESKQAESLQELLGIAQDELKRMDRIIDQFLTAIRPTQPQFQSLQVNELLRETVNFLSPELKKCDVKVKMELREDLPLLPLDADQIKQAFYNLIRNAAQAMTQGGILKISSAYTDYEVTLSFEDRGKGISAENLSNLFQPFFTTRKSGTGLGLLIVRRIIREHGGEIELKSKEGRGTKVNIYLPLIEKRMRYLAASHEEEKAPLDIEHEHT